jgi:hypothetical protein
MFDGYFACPATMCVDQLAVLGGIWRYQMVRVTVLAMQGAAVRNPA